MSDTDFSRMMTEVIYLRKNQLRHCESCGKLESDYTGTFHICPMMGSVEPGKDGCSRWREK